MKNLVNGGFEGEIYPVNPKATEILGKKVYADVSDLPDGVDVAVFAIPAKFVVDTIAKVGDKGIATAIMIPSGFAETGEVELQQQLVDTAREHGVRFVGPNIYGVYYTAGNMSAAFTTPYDVQGPGRAGVAERRHRDGDPRLRPLDARSASRRSSGSATSPTSTRTTC